MTALIRARAATVLLAVLGAAPLAAQVQPPDSGPPLVAPAQQDQFIPIDQLPPEDRLAAAPLLIGAYVFVLLALSAYLLSVARRLNIVQRELNRLESDFKRTGRT